MKAKHWIMVDFEDGANADHFDSKEAAQAALAVENSEDYAIVGYDKDGEIVEVLVLQHFGSKAKIVPLKN